MRTRKVTVIDLDDGDQIVVNVGDVSVKVSNGYLKANRPLAEAACGLPAPVTINIIRPTTDGRRLRTTIKDVKGDGQTTCCEEVAEVEIEPWCCI